jgi:predicted HicB family RNase H-like nuclease
MEYKGYIGRSEFDPAAQIFHGEVVNTRDVITFSATRECDLITEFERSVEDYLAFCGERGEQPSQLNSTPG